VRHAKIPVLNKSKNHIKFKLFFASQTLSKYLDLYSIALVYIDLEKRFILHDCGDWRKIAREKQFCKHIGALMLALPEDAARAVLEGIKRQRWEFGQYTGRGEVK
jgi:hypothetical protein